MSAEVFGSLDPLYQEYLNVVANATEEMHRVDYFPSILPDKIANAEKTAPHDATLEEKLAHIEQSKYFFIDGKKHALLKAHFVGTAAELFKEYVEIKDTGEDPDDEFMQKVKVLKAVPPEQQKGATVNSLGYYWAGNFNRVSDDN